MLTMIQARVLRLFLALVSYLHILQETTLMLTLTLRQGYLR